MATYTAIRTFKYLQSVQYTRTSAVQDVNKEMADKEILYVSMDLHRWDGCKLKGLPDEIFNGLGNGSIGFMAVFDDIEKLKKAYPDSKIKYAVRSD